MLDFVRGDLFIDGIKYSFSLVDQPFWLMNDNMPFNCAVLIREWSDNVLTVEQFRGNDEFVRLIYAKKWDIIPKN